MGEIRRKGGGAGKGGGVGKEGGLERSREIDESVTGVSGE